MKYFFSLTIPLLVSFGQVFAQEKTSLADTARFSNRAAIQAIESFYCVYEANTNYAFGKTLRTDPTQHWQVGSSMRKFARNGDQSYDMLIEHGVMKIKNCRNENKHIKCTGVISQYEGTGIGLHDLHQYCLFRFIGASDGSRSRKMVVFDDMLKGVPHKIIAATKVMDQDRPAVKIEVEFQSDLVSTYWFDTNRNYLIYRVENNFFNSITKQQERRVCEIQKFHHAGNGVYFPESVFVNHTVKDGKPFITAKFNVSNIRINKPIPANEMALSFPPGTEVTNNITGKTAKVNSDGKLVDTGEEIPQPLPVSTSAAISSQPVEYEKTVEREPFLNRILPYLSLAFLISAGVIFFYRRRMQRKLEP